MVICDIIIKYSLKGLANMSTLQASNTSQAAIFARIWERKDGQVPVTLARHLVKLDFSADDKSRMHELAEKNQEGAISKAELEELDNFIRVGDMLAIVQSKA